MYNLWRLIVRHQLILTFILCQGFALVWFFSSHGYPRGQWVRASLEVQGTWNEYVSDMSQLTELAHQNEQLLLENAQLRSELLKSKQRNNPLSTESKFANTIVPTEVIRSTAHLSANFIIINSGSDDGVETGQGALHRGFAVAKVVETTANHALLLPLIHTGMEWSARLGKNGPVGRLFWNGKDTQIAHLDDIPRNFAVSPGDTIYTSGFQGIFPPELTFGYATTTAPEQDGEFQRIQITLGAPFQELRYLHIVDDQASEAIELWMNPTP
ncbi:MAG: rod shape-determining protein MreC [Flavobacteriales bacterium]|nr:rod shape-determining protein MreC [Flavobacteriales bacterium]